MLAFGSKGGRFPAMKGIPNWVLDLRTLLHGTHTVSTSVASLTSKRFVFQFSRTIH
jgi:hypothetical protein